MMSVVFRFLNASNLGQAGRDGNVVGNAERTHECSASRGCRVCSDYCYLVRYWQLGVSTGGTDSGVAEGPDAASFGCRG
jgi:hypothetical protein